MICHKFQALIFLCTLAKYLVLHDLVHHLPKEVVNVHGKVQFFLKAVQNFGIIF